MIILRLKENKGYALDIDVDPSHKKNENIINYQKIRRDEDFMFNEFHRRFPGMKKYIQITQTKGKKVKNEAEGFMFNDNHFCIFFWILIMLILNIVGVVLNLNVFNNYLNNDNILTLLSAQPNFKSK